MFAFSQKDFFTDGIIDLRVTRRDDGAIDARPFPMYVCGVFIAGTHTMVGDVTLRLGDPATDRELYYDGNIGYNTRPEHRGHGYAGRSVRLVCELAREHGMKEVTVHCNVTNGPSKRVIEKLGAKLLEVVETPREFFDAYDKTPLRMRYSIEL